MSSLPTSAANRDIDSTLRENRVFPPPAEFSAKAHIKSLEEYEALYKQSIEDPEKFWAEAARELHWFEPWDKVLEWNLPWAKWFVGGKINLSYNCVDRHALGARANKTAIIWEGEPGEIRRLTYAELHAEVQKFANALKSLGIQKGDRVAVYMGMTPELAIALLGLRAHRRGALGDLWRICRQRHCRSRGGLGMRGHPDAGHELPARQRGEAQGDRRRGDARMSHGEARGGVQAHGDAGEHGGRPRPLVARAGG